MIRTPGCRCGHDADAHEHYRKGRDCGACRCKRFVAANAALLPSPAGPSGSWRRLVSQPR